LKTKKKKEEEEEEEEEERERERKRERERWSFRKARTLVFSAKHEGPELMRAYS
jgi:hypothetical protein